MRYVKHNGATRDCIAIARPRYPATFSTHSGPQ
jgi:hypothetical protein